MIMSRDDCMVPGREEVSGYIVFDALDYGFNAFPVWDIFVHLNHICSD